MTAASPRFLGLPDRLADGRVPRVVIFGAARGSTYPGDDSIGYELAADAIRAASQVDAALVENWDFDLGGPLFDGKPVCCIDTGDIPTIMHDNAGNRALIEAKTREVLGIACRTDPVGGDAGLSSPSTATASIPASCQGVAARTPGGLTYTQVIDLIAGLGRRARIVGFDLVEFSARRHRRAVRPHRVAPSRQCDRRHRPAGLRRHGVSASAPASSAARPEGSTG